MLPCREMVEFAGMTTPKMTTPHPPVTIKQHANRRLYQPDAGTYGSLGDLAAMVEDGEDFVACDAETSIKTSTSKICTTKICTDITSAVLKQITFEHAHHG
jgi:polyhydroxyalkanoate synthesis regulator protein